MTYSLRHQKQLDILQSVSISLPALCCEHSNSLKFLGRALSVGAVSYNIIIASLFSWRRWLRVALSCLKPGWCIELEGARSQTCLYCTPSRESRVNTIPELCVRQIFVPYNFS